MIKVILESMRPKQWIKNLIVLAPLAFAQKMFDGPLAVKALLAFAAFCLASSGVYLVNDILDREADRHHPEKKDRPIASGRLPVATAATIAVILFLASLGLGLYIRPWVLAIAGMYIGLNLAYSTALKRMVIVDAFCIAFGFVLRIVAGAKALGVRGAEIEISTWIVLCTLLGSLFLAFCKRRHELGLADKAADHRAILAEYSIGFLDQMIAITTACTVMAYSLWTISPGTLEKFHTQRLFWTVPFVCYGIFRYLYLVHQKNLGGSPSKVFLTDAPLIVNIFLWFLVVVFVLYGKTMFAPYLPADLF